MQSSTTNFRISLRRAIKSQPDAMLRCSSLLKAVRTGRPLSLLCHSAPSLLAVVLTRPRGASKLHCFPCASFCFLPVQWIASKSMTWARWGNRTVLLGVGFSSTLVTAADAHWVCLLCHTNTFRCKFQCSDFALWTIKPGFLSCTVFIVGEEGGLNSRVESLHVPKFSL